MRANKLQAEKKAIQSGYTSDVINEELKYSLVEAEELLDDLRSKNQKMFMTNIVIMVTANDYDELENNTEAIEAVVRKHICSVSTLKFQQEKGLQYPPYDEITELNQYGNKDIADIDENSVLAVLAVIRYRDLQEDDDNGGDEEKEIKFEFTDDEIQEVIEKFYDFEYRYEYGNCHYPYCKCKTEVTIYNEGTPYEYTVESTEYYCDVQHQWLYGEVTNVCPTLTLRRTRCADTVF